jgi:hypothetical protein
MKSKFKKLMAAALVLCLVLALLPAAAFADVSDGTREHGQGEGSLSENTYTIKVQNNKGSAPANGTVTVTVNGGEAQTVSEGYQEFTAAAGDKVTVECKAKPNAAFVSLESGDVTLNEGGGGTFTFEMPEKNVTLTVMFQRLYSITTATDLIIENGAIDFPEEAYNTQEVTITATPNAGYELESVSVNGVNQDYTAIVTVSGNEAKFIMPNFAVIINSVTFKPVAVEPNYTVNCQVTGVGGTIHVNDNQAFHEGDTVNVYVSADPGYQLKSMYAIGDDSENLWTANITNTHSFTMPGCNVVVYATFSKVADTYTIGTNVTGKGTVTVSPTGPVAEGEWVTVTATPAEGYKLAALRYFVDGETLAPENVTSGVAFPMPGYNITVYAVFVPVSGEYAINVTTDGGCTVSQPVSAAYGDYVTIDIYMNAGHHLYNVYLDNELVTDDVYWYNGQWHYSFYMPRHDVDIYVTTTTKYFVNPIYNIDGGTVEVWVKDAGGWDSTIFADKGDWVCFKVSPYSGYELGSVSVIGRWSNQSYDVHYNNYDGCYYFKMHGESVDLSVSFVDGQHRVYVKDVSNGSLTANVNWAAEGDKVYVTAKPSKGYELTWLSVKAADGTVLKIYEALGENTYYFYMPDQYVTVSGIFSVISSGLPFVDVNSGAWYYDAVSFVYNKGIMNGVTSTTFEPNSTITRGMVVTMLWRMAGEPYVSGGSFSDVASGRYYSTAVAWAAKNGIVDGYSSTVFGVNDPVTREQFATILYRYAKYMGYSTTGSSLTGYYDANSVSSWARDAMGWAVKNGIITGSGNSRLNPTGTASRAEVAQMFMSFYEFTT